MTHPANPLSYDLNRALDVGRDDWESLRGERLFITGGTGFVGCWLLETLAWADLRLGLGLRAVVLTRDPERFRRKAPHLAGSEAVELVRGDVTTFEPPPGPFTHVIHGAAEAGTRQAAKDPQGMRRVVVEGTRRVLSLAGSSGAVRLLLLSSGAVYGRQPLSLDRIEEDFAGSAEHTSHPSAYVEAKRRAEELCRSHDDAPRLGATIARGFSFVGPYLPVDAHYAIGNFIRDGLRGGPITVESDGSDVRSYMYAADLAVWLWAILVRGESGRAYNVGSEQKRTIVETAHAVAARFTDCPEVVVVGRADPADDRSRYVACTRRARTELGVTESVGLDEAIRRTILWHKKGGPS